MRPYLIAENPNFVGRRAERLRLDEITSAGEARFIAVYGRRRIGKTELIEQYFRRHTVLKFEGIEISPEDRRPAQERKLFQIVNCAERLARYLENPLLARVNLRSWTEFFELIDDVVRRDGNRNLVLYFEEIQWLADYHSDIFAELKPFWDDSWRHRRDLTVVLCGSSTSFLMKQILSDRALYGRVHDQIHLGPLNLAEIAEYFKGSGKKEIMSAQLAVGGVCAYLERLKGRGGVFAHLCGNSFVPDAYFLHECRKIFVSHMSGSKYYEGILAFLARRKFAASAEIAKALRGNPKSGGSLTNVLEELEECRFIEKYSPLNKREASKLVRYCLSDEYLRWYYKFIQPARKAIEAGKFASHPAGAVNRRSFEITMGLNFERWCRKHSHLFARIMEFAGVEYEAGAYFHRKSEARPGVQIDLMYIIKGSKIVICEIKYAEGPVSGALHAEAGEKLELFRRAQPRYENYTFETVLITPEGIRGYAPAVGFDRVITFKEIFDPRYWEHYATC